MCTIPIRSTTTAASKAMAKTRRRSHSTWLDWPCRRQRKSIHAVPSQTSRDRIYQQSFTNTDNDDYSDSDRIKNGIRISVDDRRMNTATATGGRNTRSKRMPRFNSVSKIDRASRVFFPFVFLLINLFYWYSYLSK